MSLRIPDTTTEERIAGLERFLEFWLGPRHPEYGEPAETLAKSELPEPLRRFLAFAGRWPQASPPYAANRFHAQDRLLPLEPARHGNVYRSGPYLVFISENQGVWQVATLPYGDDPGIWVSEDSSHRTPSPIWLPLDRPLSHFLVSFVLQETLFSSDFVASHENALAVFETGGSSIEPIWREGEFVWPDVRHSYYLVDGCILLRRDVGDAALDDQWYSYRDTSAAELLDRLGLPISLA